MSTLAPVRVSYSQLSTWRDCWLKGYLHYVQGWRRDEPNEKLDLGTVWHMMLETHYRGIMARQQAENRRSPGRGTHEEAAWLAALRPDVMDVLERAHMDYPSLTPQNFQVLRWMHDGHTELYGLDPNWRILAVEVKDIAILGEITTPEGVRTVELDYRIDLVVEDSYRGGVWIVDHKSCANLSDRITIELDDQGGLYWWAFAHSDHPLAKQVNGYLRNEAKKTQNKGDHTPGPRTKAQALSDRMQRVPANHGAKELENIAADALATAQAVYGGGAPIHSSPNPQQCGWKCPFVEPHILMRKGQDPEVIMRDFGFRRIPTIWNGLSHED